MAAPGQPRRAGHRLRAPAAPPPRSRRAPAAGLAPARSGSVLGASGQVYRKC